MYVSGAPESAAGVNVVGLHQPSPEKRHRGDRKCDKDQQNVTAAGRGQISFPKPQGKSQKLVFLGVFVYFVSLLLILTARFPVFCCCPHSILFHFF